MIILDNDGVLHRIKIRLNGPDNMGKNTTTTVTVFARSIDEVKAAIVKALSPPEKP